MTSQAVMALLPVLVPLVLNLLKTGSSKAGAVATGNPVMNAFLDSDGDGDVDLGDLMSHASRFM